MKPFFARRAERRKRWPGIYVLDGAADGSVHGRRQMNFASLILAFAFLFGGLSFVGSTDGNLPHVGSFAFNGQPVPAAPATLAMVSVR